MARRERGSVQKAVLEIISTGDGTTRWTPYAIGQITGISVGSVTAACIALTNAGTLEKVGDRPYMVKRKH